MSLIQFENAQFSYDGKRNALNGVSLSIELGSFVCVLGGNGSGKSTFAKHINALLTPDAGRVIVLDLDTSLPENVFRVRSNAGMVFQNPDDQIVASIIENDVAFGPENLGVPSDDLRRRVEKALSYVGLQCFEKKQTETLSGGQKQRVAMAGVLAMEPQILVLDEASAMLDPRGRDGLLRVCKSLNEKGLTIVLITHFMEEAALADRVIVFEKGAIALDGTPDEVLLQADRLAALELDVPFATHLSLALRNRNVPIGLHAKEDELERDLIDLLRNRSAKAGADVARAYETCAPNAVPTREEHAPNAAGAPAAYQAHENARKPVIEFRGVSFTYDPLSQERRRKSSVAPEGKQADWGRSPSEYWTLSDLSLEVREGEILGIAGHTGSGKSTLIQLANGLLKPNEGTVLVEGRALSDKRTIAEARRNVGLVFQYPEHQLFASTVYDDVAFGPRNLGLPADQVDERVHHAMEFVHLDFDDLRDRNPFDLSGGQQRRVALAGVLAMQPHVLVLDEPVAGLDPRTKQRLLDLLVELRDQRGLTVVIVSHNMDDLAALCDRILVLNEGRMVVLDTPETIFADEQALKDIGLGVPHAAHLINRLASAGIVFPGEFISTADELANAIASGAYRLQEGR